MTRTMYDAVTPSRIPAGAAMVAGYANGRYANLAEMATRFPHAIRVSISVSASYHGATVLDVEIGDATPAEAPGWVKARRAAGIDPTVYCNASTWPAVKAAFTAAGIPQPHYWIAQYDNDPTIPAGAVAKQYKNTAGWDASSVADHWPGVDPAPHPNPTPTPHPEADMPLFAVTPTGLSGASFPRGSAKTVGFFTDNTFIGGAADPGATLRVVVWSDAHGPEIHQVTVTSKSSRQTVIPFKDPASTHSVTVTRTDTGKPYPVFAEVS